RDYPPGDLCCRDGHRPPGHPGQCRLRRIGSDPGIYRCGKDAIGVKGQDGSATLWWDAGAGCLCYIEQTLLPNEFVVIGCRDTGRLATAIRRLEIRGAPALGVAGAYGVALAALTSAATSREQFLDD